MYLKQVCLDCHLSILNIIFAHIIRPLLIPEHLAKEIREPFSSHLCMRPHWLDTAAVRARLGELCRGGRAAAGPGRGWKGRGGAGREGRCFALCPRLQGPQWDCWGGALSCPGNCTARSKEPSDAPATPCHPCGVKLLFKEDRR